MKRASIVPVAVRQPRRIVRSWLGVALVAALIAGTADAQFVSIQLGGPHPAKPSPNRSLLGAPADVAAALAGRGRPAAMVRLDQSRRPAEVLAFLGLSQGARVLVIEADSGYYSEIIGTALGTSGHVTTLVPPAELKDPARRAVLSDLTARVPGLLIVANDPAKMRLSPDSFDFVLLHLVYHELHALSAGETAVFLQSIFTALRPDGIAGVVDYDAVPGRDVHPAAGLGRIGAAVVQSDFRRAGFVLDSGSDLLANAADDRSKPVQDIDDPAHADRFVLRFRKPE